MTIEFIQQNIWVFVILILWELVWKGIALWKAAKRDEKYWFIALLFINTAGILPILYILLKKSKNNMQGGEKI